ncbi:MAG: 1-phosphofructokinase [Terrisporobacter othiniensis]|uniref:1-phosphofructokinase n=1 Tax=Terrisporobacter petrolearius TaxID=1460447 RepID=UPI0008EF8877|nr:1-phosphofructokinase [Terrisporobacter petrolearius]MDU4861589.1 1-phosphofructokinase [Terrisporobacter othiniensis]MDU6995492.1 1-phosphofructokinase [Terrisporobacter othiniensis]SFJ51297.1 tagatose 6-phosphate kinase [Terrisporobacter glycolicus]
MITTVTLNVSIDKAYKIKGCVESGKVIRVLECNNTAGGKGLNVSRVASLCGEEVLATGFVGGHCGALAEELLEKDNIKNKFTHVKSETRSCINILDENNVSTEFLEKGDSISDEEINAFLDDFDKIIEDSNVITISGSAPKGVPTNIYTTLINMIKAKNKKVILDASGDLLKEGIKALPTMIKPNSEEMENLLNVSINNEEEVIKNAIKLHESGIELVVVSLGSDGALLVCKEGVYHGKPPKIEVVNTVGCGDSMVAAFAVAMERGYSNIDSLKYAISISAANAMTFSTGSFNSEDVDNIFKNTQINKIY